MTKLEAANKALILLGVETIPGLEADVKAARVMKELMPSVIRAVLTEFPWAFALKAKALESTKSEIPGWRYAFRYPTDAVVLYRVFAPQTKALWKILYITLFDIIFTNEPDVWAEYTVEVDFERWPEMAAEAFVSRLASDAAVALTGSAQNAMTLLQKYQLIAGMAKGNSMNEEFSSPRVEASHYTDVRG